MADETQPSKLECVKPSPQAMCKIIDNLSKDEKVKISLEFTN